MIKDKKHPIFDDGQLNHISHVEETRCLFVEDLTLMSNYWDPTTIILKKLIISNSEGNVAVNVLKTGLKFGDLLINTNF